MCLRIAKMNHKYCSNDHCNLTDHLFFYKIKYNETIKSDCAEFLCYLKWAPLNNSQQSQ